MSSDSVHQTVTGDHNIFSATGDVHVHVAPPPLAPAEAKERRDLGILLRRVKQFWITDYLEKSLHAEAILQLGKEIQINAVAHPWERQVELPNQTREVIPPSKKIGDIFDELNRALLILGEPGSGKTVTLLELARDLIARAEAGNTFTQPIPVVFNLSSWTDTRQSLPDWIVAELSAKYYVPKRIGRPWLDQNRILPLLDGLDEVKAENRAACVKAINDFAKSFALPGLVVCSRRAEYTSLPARLELSGAICLQRLSQMQVEEYLAAGGQKTEPLRAALKVDSTLAELAQSPLTLNIMVIAYCEGETIPAQRPQTVEASRKTLFDTYVEKMFKRKGKADVGYTEDRTKYWLSWLAQGMRQHSQSIFLIEQLQPSWLGTRKQQLSYFLASRTVIGSIWGLLWAVPIALVNLWQPLGYDGYIRGLASFLLMIATGLLSGCNAGMIDAFYRVPAQQPLVRGRFLRLFKNVFLHAIAGVVVGGLAGAVILSPVLWLSEATSFLEPLFGGSLVGSVLGGLMGIPFGLVFWRRRVTKITDDILTTEKLSWSWGEAKRSVGKGASLGAILGLVVPLVVLISMSWYYGITIVTDHSDFMVLMPALIVWFIVGGVLGAVVGAFFGGMQSVDLDSRSYPAQGIVVTAKNLSMLGLGAWLLAGSVSILFTLLSFGLNSSAAFPVFLNFLVLGTLVGVPTALWFGGRDLTQHYTLRIQLWLKGYAPLNFVRFLDHACKLIFMRRVGGGYVFVHRLLLEHFAAMNAKGNKDQHQGGF